MRPPRSTRRSRTARRPPGRTSAGVRGGWAARRPASRLFSVGHRLRPPSGPRMGSCVDLPDAFAGQVGVELGGADTRMTEQLLDDPQVRSALEQVGRERVAERVRRDPVAQAGSCAAPRTTANACWRANRRPRSPRNSGPPRAGVTWWSARSAGRASAIQRASQSSAMSPTGTSRSLSPLPMTRTKPPSVERSSRSSPSASLTRRPAAYSSSSRARARRSVRPWRLEERLDLGDVEGLGQESRLARQVEVGGDVDADQALAEGEPVEAANARGAAAEAGGGKAGSPGRPRRVRAAR